MFEQDECFCWCHGHEPEPGDDEPISHCAACEPAVARLIEVVAADAQGSAALSVAEGIGK